jgi:hypothetical protein
LVAFLDCKTGFPNELVSGLNCAGKTGTGFNNPTPEIPKFLVPGTK